MALATGPIDEEGSQTSGLCCTCRIAHELGLGMKFAECCSVVFRIWQHFLTSHQFLYLSSTLVTALCYVKVKKVKCTLVQALRLCTGRTARRGSRGIALPFLDHDTRKGEGSASRPGRSLPRGKTRHPLCRRLGGPQGRSGQVRKISLPPRFDPRTVQRVASRYTDCAIPPTNTSARTQI
jgi:hypothetical protein